MPATLIRQDGTNATLALEGAVRVVSSAPRTVTTEPVQGLDVVTKGVYIGAPVVDLEAVLTATPSVQGITSGPARFEEVARWLESAVGIPVTLSVPGDAPVRDLFVGSSTIERGVLVRTLRLQLVRARVAIGRTVEQGQRAPAPGSKAAPRSGFAPAVDEGPAPTQRRQSAAASAVDALAAFAGL